MFAGEDKLSWDQNVTRRGFLRSGGAGLAAFGIGRSHLEHALKARSDPERSIILLLLVGGPSQIETWDPKPDAPAEVRGPFGAIATRCPGVFIIEQLPRIAARLDRLAIVRSMHHDSAPIHEAGYQLIQTGRLSRTKDDENPHLGSVLARLEKSTAGGPKSVVVPRPIACTGIDIPRGQTAGWLGSAFDPSYSSPCASGVSPIFSCETNRIAPDYGQTPFGRSCRLARQLVEAGVRVVTVNMFDTVFNRVTWDCHGAAPFSTLDDYARSLLPTFDYAFSALIDDLESRGRLETTLVVAAGEFGRTPHLNASGGRDHWPGVWSVVLAGGGIRGGQVIGASDAHGGTPIDRPVTPADLLATMYYSLGIDASQALVRPGGDGYQLVEGGTVIRELFV